MSIIINKGYTDTFYEGTPTLTRGKLNFARDFRVKKDSGGELLLANLTSPLDRGEQIMLTHNTIKNVYDKTDIDPSVYAPSRRGVALYAKIQDTFEVTDSSDAEFCQHLPLKASLSITVPASAHITAADIEVLVGRLVSTLYDTGSVTTERLNALLRGSLKPSDL